MAPGKGRSYEVKVQPAQEPINGEVDGKSAQPQRSRMASPDEPDPQQRNLDLAQRLTKGTHQLAKGLASLERFAP